MIFVLLLASKPMHNNIYIQAHKAPEKQCLFPIVQGGLDNKLREICAKAMVERNLPGYAIGQKKKRIRVVANVLQPPLSIGGLSGGELKAKFWRVVRFTAALLPDDKPRFWFISSYDEEQINCIIYHKTLCEPLGEYDLMH